MARLARVVVPGMAHHVVQWGNRGLPVFLTESDYQVYLDSLQDYGVRRGLELWAYCLMPNHVHLIVVPKRPWSLARGLQDAHTAYTSYFNRREGNSGHLWQGRFQSSVLDEDYLWAAVRYVERNPVRAGLVRVAARYRWSSAAAHCGVRHDPYLSPNFPPPGVIADWREWLRQEDLLASEAVRKCTRTGRVCGAEDVVIRLEKRLRRPLRRAKPGPKPKPKGGRQPRLK